MENNDVKIIFEGIKNIDKIPHLLFKIEIEGITHMECKIPSDDITCNHIMKHLTRFIPVIPKMVEPGNLEEPSVQS